MTGLMKYRNVRWPQTYRKYAVIAVIENKTVRELEKKINTSSFQQSEEKLRINSMKNNTRKKTHCFKRNIF